LRPGPPRAGAWPKARIARLASQKQKGRESMNRTMMQKLRLDRRLIGRRGWLSRDALAKELDALPDVSTKIAPPEADEPEKPPAAAGEGPTHPS
jgi:hypothetical protein